MTVDATGCHAHERGSESARRSCAEPASGEARVALEGTGAQEGEVAVLPPDVFDAEGRCADRDAPAHVGGEGAGLGGRPRG
jgi:hypothetical protein